jgi:hypothetical protein
MKFESGLKVIPALFFIVVSAFGQEVHYNYDRGANFSGYKTYQWVEIPSSVPNANASVVPPQVVLPGPPPNLPAFPQGILSGAPNFRGAPTDVRTSGTEDQLIDQEIKRAVDEQLAHKGLTKVDKNADLQVVYHAATSQEVNLKLFGSTWGGRGYGGMWDGSVQGQTSTVAVGTLVVDLYNPTTKHLVWRGDATKTIELKKDPDKNFKNLQKSMTKLFKNYPPQANK